METKFLTQSVYNVGSLNDSVANHEKDGWKVITFKEDGINIVVMLQKTKLNN